MQENEADREARLRELSARHRRALPPLKFLNSPLMSNLGGDVWRGGMNEARECFRKDLGRKIGTGGIFTKLLADVAASLAP